MRDERQLARGGIERIGGEQSRCVVTIGDYEDERLLPVPNHAAAVEQCLAQLMDPTHGCLADAGEVAAIGFKAVHGGRVSGVVQVDRDVLEAMQEMAPVAPAHNRPYIAAMKQLHEQLPQIPLVAAFETDFHRTIPDRLRSYAVPREWAEDHHIRRWGFHGASHRYIAERTAQIAGSDTLRLISCHLGGSSSLAAIRNRQSVATSMGMSPQSGLPQNNRVGDFDPYAVRLVMERTGKSHDEVLEILASQSGLLGLSGVSGDVRDLLAAAGGGHSGAQLALDVYVSSIRHYLGAYLVELGGCDWIAFTGGIGENSPEVRSAVCDGLGQLGIRIDSNKNAAARGETQINDDNSRVAVWVVPTNEEIIVARQARDLLT